VYFSGLQISVSNMPNAKHLMILKQGVEVWNKWRGDNSEIQPDLTHTNLRATILDQVDFSNTDLSHSDFYKASLINANLKSANLSRAKLNGVDLSNAYLEMANLNVADFTNANLMNAKLHRADLLYAIFSHANLNGATLSATRMQNTSLSHADVRNASFENAILNRAILAGSDFTGSSMGGTVLADNDISNVIGLDSVKHSGPSVIGIDTLYRSNGEIPASFLQGCGVPETFLTFIPSLIGAQQAIQFYSCFISYSTKDESFARRLHSRMRDAQLRVWFAPEDIKGGEKLHEQIEQAIRLYDKLLIVLSENSLQSEWVITEIRKARRAEVKENRRKLFPIRIIDMEAIRTWECFDADAGKDLAIELREYFIPDFSNWKSHDAFEAAFHRLLQDLKASE
jgi:uncharacterized protein YjbI with pentapeptide repeats